MSQSDRVRHIIKGINTVAFSALATQNPATIQDVIATCQRLEELQSLRLCTDNTDIRLPSTVELRTLIRDIVREELHGRCSSCATEPGVAPSPTGLRDIIKQEIASASRLTCSDGPCARHVPTYAEVAALPPVTAAPLPTDHYAHVASLSPPVRVQPYRSAQLPTRPICYYCGYRGHISRFCRRRQQDEQRGYTPEERTGVRPATGYQRTSYRSFNRSPSPPYPTNTPLNSRESRRRSPSPRRRSVSPLRPASHVSNARSENSPMQF